jgi:hypothetical protein
MIVMDFQLKSRLTTAMLAYYRKAIIDLKTQINELSRAPDNHELLFQLQCSLIKRVVNTERKIITHKVRRNLLKPKLIEKGLSRRTARDLTHRISALDRRIGQFQWMLYIYRSFGDAIAFLYLDKWNIKPLLYDQSTAKVKQDSGYLTAKKGLINEIALILDAKKNNVPALLTDLTNSIRYGDVCLLGSSVPELLEVKSSHNKNSRINRQLSELTKVQDYLLNDEGYDIRGAAFCQRVNIRIPERNYIDQLNMCIAEALDVGHASRQPGPGFHIFVKATGSPVDYDKVFGSLSQPVPFFLNEYKNNEWWMSYYPFTLSIRKPEHLFLFLNGDIFILVIVDLGEMSKLADKRQLRFTPLNDPDMAFQIEGKRDYLESPFVLKISQHLFTRIALECLSLEWVLDMAGDNISQYQVLAARHDTRLKIRADRRTSGNRLVVVRDPRSSNSSGEVPEGSPNDQA